MEEKEYIGKHAKLENVRTPIGGACFHGECWLRCPKCDKAFEVYDTKFERGFTHIRGNIYRHDACGQLLDME